MLIDFGKWKFEHNLHPFSVQLESLLTVSFHYRHCRSFISECALMVRRVCLFGFFCFFFGGR